MLIVGASRVQDRVARGETGRVNAAIGTVRFIAGALVGQMRTRTPRAYWVECHRKVVGARATISGMIGGLAITTTADCLAFSNLKSATRETTNTYAAAKEQTRSDCGINLEEDTTFAIGSARSRKVSALSYSGDNLLIRDILRYRFDVDSGEEYLSDVLRDAVVLCY